jgi:hypothetical protein
MSDQHAESVAPRPRTYYAWIGNDEYLCPHCGAAVIDPDMHQDWHALTGTLISKRRGYDS